MSLFGPGYGESAVIHLGGGRWMVVDSCVDTATSRSAPLQYLHDLGVDSERRVVLVVASHWHDDHVRGLAELVTACSSAKFGLSEALHSEGFLQLAKGYGARSRSSSSGISEFAGVLKALERRGKRRDLGKHVLFASSGKVLLRQPEKARTPGMEVHCLSPTDGAVLDAFAHWARLMPSAGQPVDRLPSERPNHVAVALWLRVGRRILLLGADLEERNTANGWTAVLASTNLPAGRAAVLKVPHHGSGNADHPGLWRDLLEERRHALVTPFLRGSVALPGADDIARLLSRAPSSYITAPPRPFGLRHTNPLVADTVASATRRFVRLPPTGQVRLRAPASSSDFSHWSVECFGGAGALSQYLGGGAP